MNAARFITLEGGDGVGKSTQVARLVARLRADGHEAIATREPGGSPKAEAIRTLLLSGAAAAFGPSAEAILFAAARLDHVRTLIRPALDRHAFVVCDRFLDSTRAYQGAAAQVDPALITALERVAVGVTRPNLTVILDLPEDVGLARARARRTGAAGADRFESLDMAFHGRLRRAFLATAAAEPDRCVVVEASEPVDTVADAIWSAVNSRLLGRVETTAAA